MVMAMKDLYQKQCKEEKKQLEMSLTDIIKVISMLEIGAKQYPENTEFELARLYRGLLKDAQNIKSTCERKIAELDEKIEM